MPRGVYSRSQIQSLRQTLDAVLKNEISPSANVRERVARIAVRIADERNVFEPETLVRLVQAELGDAEAASPVAG